MRRWGYCEIAVLPILEAFRFAKLYVWRRRYYLSGILAGARVRCCVRAPHGGSLETLLADTKRSLGQRRVEHLGRSAVRQGIDASEGNYQRIPTWGVLHESETPCGNTPASGIFQH
jgi:hypothetical protein